MNFSFLLPILYSLFLFLPLLGTEQAETGTLIVSYHTDAKGERLHRVRFMLTSEKNEGQIYPKGDAFVEDKNPFLSRMVAIENLPVGQYTLEFMVPNVDGLFEKVPKKTLDIKKDEVIRLDQHITHKNIKHERIIATESDIAYVRLFGSLTIQAAFPNKEPISLIIKPKNGPPLSIKLEAQGGMINWQSPPLAPGIYSVAFILPSGLEKIPPLTIAIHPGEQVQLTPRLLTKGSIHIISNVPEAVFFLRSTKDNNAWKGEGREYTFWNLSPGYYQLSLETHEPDFFVSPPEMRFYLSEFENKEVKAPFQLVGKLTIKTNVPRAQLTIQEIDSPQKIYQEQISDNATTVTLPEGGYTVKLSPVPSESPSGVRLYPPDPVEVNVRALSTAELHLNYRIENTPPTEKQRKLTISSNIANAAFTVKKINGNNQEEVGHFSGKYIQITLPEAKAYEITFDNVPNYTTPEKIETAMAAGEEKILQAIYLPIQQMEKVPAGRAIIGNATSEQDVNTLPSKIVTLTEFAIARYEVTNAQFATWLSQALKAGKITYVQEADSRGHILDMENRLLFKTFEADPYSQISTQLHSIDGPTFLPLPGKDSFPVISVSWYGATAYCLDNNCRLPTEAEWEKAAGMAPEMAGQPLKKFRYGFSQNEIDPTWANYKSSDRSIQFFQVLTTPIGFYNGINLLPLNTTNKNPVQTHLAKSPYGAFDMSGNVWEWVNDWYDDAYYANMSDKDPKGPTSGTKKVVKGGCYDSLADGVRVSERLGLPPDHTDAYTGFRIAK